MAERKMRIGLGVLAAALTCAGCTNPAPQKIVARPITPVPPVPAMPYEPLRVVMLAAHNAARSAVGEPGLGWNPALARAAAEYAAELARSRRFAHSEQPDDDGAHGENLWMGTRGAFRLDEMVGHWVAEKKAFKRGPSPWNATTGRFEDVGHYTQIIWRGTTQVGCAIAANKAEEYLVCRYLPAGNVIGIDPLAS